MTIQTGWESTLIIAVHALDVNQDKDGYGDKSFFMCFVEKEAQLQQQKFPVTKNLEWDFSLVINSCSKQK